MELYARAGQRHLVFNDTVGSGGKLHSPVEIVKRILRKYGYPPDKQERAAQTVLEQAEAL